jgi:hypothetical protein
MIYGLKGGTFTADAFTRTELPITERAGIMTQIGFLASHAGSTQPDLVHRGLFVIEHLMCGAVPPPIPNVTAPAATPGKTNRQLWEAQTHSGACAPCHRELINPVGFAYESLDAIGAFRSMDNGQMVDATGFYRFPDSGEKRFNGPVELAKVLAETPEVHACYARSWLAYVHGRTPQDGDQAEITRLGQRLGKEKLSIKGLLLDMVGSPSFLTRTP